VLGGHWPRAGVAAPPDRRVRRAAAPTVLTTVSNTVNSGSSPGSPADLRVVVVAWRVPRNKAADSPGAAACAAHGAAEMIGAAPR
jgi:hypothetical protein